MRAPKRTALILTVIGMAWMGWALGLAGAALAAEGGTKKT